MCQPIGHIHTSRSASAPDHEPIQGKQYTDAAFFRLNNSLLRRIGTLNCGHAAFPIILGVNEPQYSDSELEQFRQENEKGINYEGQHFTLYEATQRQRELERAVRKRKRKILIDKAAGDEERLAIDQTRLVVLGGEYARFSRAAGLKMQRERMDVAGFGGKEARDAEKKMRESKKSLANTQESGIIKTEMLHREDDARAGFKFISDEHFDRLTIEARKNGATILRGDPWVEKHLAEMGASASAIGDTLMFRKDVCVCEVLEETYHFKQNLAHMNDDKGEPLRTILNEIDAKQFILDNAQKYKVPRNEIELIRKQLAGYQEQLSALSNGGE